MADKGANFSKVQYLPGRHEGICGRDKREGKAHYPGRSVGKQVEPRASIKTATGCSDVTVYRQKSAEVVVGGQRAQQKLGCLTNAEGLNVRIRRSHYVFTARHDSRTR